MTRRIIGVLLMVDGLLAGVWFTGLIGSLGIRRPASVALIVARLVTGMLAVAAGWLVTQERPPGARLAVVAVWLTAIVAALGVATGSMPTNLAPSLRWPVVGAYAVVAVVVTMWARRKMRGGGTRD